MQMIGWANVLSMCCCLFSLFLRLKFCVYIFFFFVCIVNIAQSWTDIKHKRSEKKKTSRETERENNHIESVKPMQIDRVECWN